MSKTFSERLREILARRDAAIRLCGGCECCGSEQVQLVDWLGLQFKYRCRKCCQEWCIEPTAEELQYKRK